MPTISAVARDFYRALSTGDVEALFATLAEDFHGMVSTGMPHGVGGEHHGRVATIAGAWGRIDGATHVDAALAHVLAVRNGQITALQQIADTVRWNVPA